jgi:hypothetical protein
MHDNALRDFDDAEMGDIEAENPNEYRRCAMAMLPILHDIIARMPDTIEKWGIAFALSSPETAGRSMDDIATQIPCERAAISIAARSFCDRHGLTYSPSMRQPQTNRNHNECRTQFRTRCNNSAASP